MTGPLDGKTYRDVMVPMGGHRRVGRGDRVVRPQQLRQHRRPGDAGRRRARARRDRRRARRRGRCPELEASLPRPLDAQQWKLTASHSAETAAGAATLRGWTSGVPQAPGMWFPVELPQPATVTELQFESSEPDAAVAAAAAAEPAPSRRRRSSDTLAATRCEVSMDGKTWSKPVADGKGSGPRTTIAFAPTRAKFVRITQTDTTPDAPAWSIRNLRIYEAPPTRASK